MQRSASSADLVLTAACAGTGCALTVAFAGCAIRQSLSATTDITFINFAIAVIVQTVTHLGLRYTTAGARAQVSGNVVVIGGQGAINGGVGGGVTVIINVGAATA